MQPTHPFEDISVIPGIRIDLKYATKDNFVGENVYGTFIHAYLHSSAAKKLKTALELLQNEKPGYGLLVYDALRPRSAQHVLFNKVKGTDQQQYVADPVKGSLHNYGLAVDLTITDENGAILDMGSGFDDFRPLSQPSKEEMFMQEGLLTPRQVENRKLLRRVMTNAGFISIPHEWWHFNSVTLQEARENFPVFE
jgi:zinc D-Ala-D-Ala dipeptidase